MLAAWASSRAVVLVLATSRLDWGTLFNDPALLWAWATGAPFGGDPDPSLEEYPGAARLVALTGRLTESAEAFGWGWVAAFLLVDLAVLVVLAQAGRTGAWLWVVGGAALGPVLWLRYDLLVSLLALVAVMLRDRRPAWSGMALGLAVLLKLWPLVLVAALAPRGRWTRWAGAGAATVGAGVLIEVVLRGPSSVLTPLTYQSDRGVQIESLWATAALIGGRDGDPTEVWEFAFRAYQLQDAEPVWATAVAVAVMASAGLGSVVAVGRCAPDLVPSVRAYAAALLAVSVVLTNTVFSPQYVIWFLPLVALAVSWSWRAPELRGPVLPVTVGTLLAVAALTQRIWPWRYPDLLRLEPSALAVLVTRNLLVLVLAGVLAWSLWRLAQAARRPQPARNESLT